MTDTEKTEIRLACLKLVVDLALANKLLQPDTETIVEMAGKLTAFCTSTCAD